MADITHAHGDADGADRRADDGWAGASGEAKGLAAGPLTGLGDARTFGDRLVPRHPTLEEQLATALERARGLEAESKRLACELHEACRDRDALSVELALERGRLRRVVRGAIAAIDEKAPVGTLVAMALDDWGERLEAHDAIDAAEGEAS